MAEMYAGRDKPIPMKIQVTLKELIDDKLMEFEDTIK